MLAGSLVFGSVAVGLVLSTGSVAGASPSPSISAVTFSGSVASPTITVTGSGFGTEADLGSPLPVGCLGAFTGSDYLNTLNLLDNTGAWQAGSSASGNCIGLLISSYSNSKIVFTLGSYYSIASYDLNQGDSFTMSLLGTSFSGIVSYTTIVNCNAGGNLQTAISNAPPGSTLIVHGTCTGNFTIGENLTLEGSGTLSGTGYSGSVLTISAGTAFLNNLTIENGNTSGEGGGIANSGTLIVTNTTVSHNSANDGGGIWNEGTLTVTNSTVTNNNASEWGGGIRNHFNSVSTTITNSTVSDNTAGAYGGGISNGQSIVTITNSTVTGNSSPNGGGFDSDATTTITNSTVSHNTAASGGGIFNNNLGTTTLANDSVNHNIATSGGGGIDIVAGGTVTQLPSDRGGVSINNNTASGNGGGIDNEGGTGTFYNATVNNNNAVNGGGVYNDAGSTLTISDTSVNHNTATSDGGGIYNNGGAVSLTASVSVNSNTAVSGGGIYSTVVLSVPAGDVVHNVPNNLVD
jgi:predicted outer membrane repeat protein